MQRSRLAIKLDRRDRFRQSSGRYTRFLRQPAGSVWACPPGGIEPQCIGQAIVRTQVDDAPPLLPGRRFDRDRMLAVLTRNARKATRAFGHRSASGAQELGSIRPAEARMQGINPRRVVSCREVAHEAPRGAMLKNADQFRARVEAPTIATPVILSDLPAGFIIRSE